MDSETVVVLAVVVGSSTFSTCFGAGLGSGKVVVVMIVGVSIIPAVVEYRQVLVLLVSNDVNWVENSMVASLGNLAANIAGFRKIKPLPFSALRSFYPKMSYKDAVLTYSVLGGQTGLWRYFDDSLSFKENARASKRNCTVHLEACWA